MTFVQQRENESFESLLRRFRKKVNQDQIKTELRKRRYFVTKGEQARLDTQKGIRRAQRKRRRQRRSY